MKAFEDLLSKRNIEIRLEKKAIEEEKVRQELEKELALRKQLENEKIQNLNNINLFESIGLGILYAIIGAIIGLIGSGLIGVVIWLIYVIFGGAPNNDTIFNIIGTIGLIIGAGSGFMLGFSDARDKK